LATCGDPPWPKSGTASATRGYIAMAKDTKVPSHCRTDAEAGSGAQLDKLTLHTGSSRSAVSVTMSISYPNGVRKLRTNADAT
jgi:hypothetical protein